MSPFTHDVLKYGLVAVVFAALATCAWANSRMMQRLQERRRELGNPWFDPRPTFAAWNGVELPIFVAAITIGVAAVMGVAALR